MEMNFLPKALPLKSKEKLTFHFMILPEMSSASSTLRIDKSLKAMNTRLLGRYQFLMQKVSKKMLLLLAILGNLPKRESMTNLASFYSDSAFMIQISADGLAKIPPEALMAQILMLISTITL